MKLIQLLIIGVSVSMIAAQADVVVERPGKNAEIVPYHCEVQINRVSGPIERNAGSIISAKYILTVAHILQDYQKIWKYFVGVGSNRVDELIYYEGERIHIHPNFVPSFIYSIGVIELNKTLIFNSFIQPVALIPRGVYGPLLNEQGKIASFDRGDTATRSRFLKITYQHIVYDERNPNENDTIVSGDLIYNRDKFCISKQLGAGFIVNFLGVDTIMAISQLDIPCAYTNLSPYTRISPAREWIYEQFGL